MLGQNPVKVRRDAPGRRIEGTVREPDLVRVCAGTWFLIGRVFFNTLLAVKRARLDPGRLQPTFVAGVVLAGRMEGAG